MNIYATEEEQLAAIKDWWKKNGISVLIGIVIALGLTYGWRYYQNYKTTRSEQASIVYSQMVNAFAEKQPKAATSLGNQLVSKYSHTPYSRLAALLLAKQAVQANDLPLAEKHLIWASDNANDPGLGQLARVRAARVLLAESKYAKALELLNKIQDKSFMPLIDATRGDIYLAQGKAGEAREAYQMAIASLPQDAGTMPLVQMKLNQLAG